MSDTISIGNRSFALEQIVRTPKATKKTPSPKPVVSFIPAFEDVDVNVTRSNFLSVLGALQVAANGDLANWSTGADDAIPAVGGAMDLVLPGRTGWIFQAGDVHALQACLADGATALLLDLTSTDYVSSMGLRVFLSTLKSLKTSGGRLVLSGLNDEVQEIIDLAGFAPLFEICTTTDQARAALEAI